MTRSRTSAAAVCASLLAAVPVTAQSVKVAGSEFQVNSFTLYYQSSPAVASEDNGDFVVVWQSSNDQDGSSLGVFGQRFSSAGGRLGAEFQVNLHVSVNQWAPSAGMDADGDFVVVWHSSNSQDGSEYGVFGRRYASSGAAIGGEFQVNTLFGIRCKRYDASGATISFDFQCTSRPRATRSCPPSPSTPPAPCSSSGRAADRMEAATVSSAGFSISI